MRTLMPSPDEASLALLEEALVRAHHHLRLHLAHRVEGDTDGNEHRRAAERPRARLGEPAVTDEEAREHSHEREEERARQRQPRENPVEVLRGGRTGPDARDVAAV